MPRIVVQAIRGELSNAEIELFRRKWAVHPVVISIAPLENWNGAVQHDSLMAGAALRTVRYPCLYLWSQIQVNVDGTVSACPTDWNRKLIVGDLRTSSVKEIWDGEAMRTLRAQHLRSEWNRCEKCDSWRIYPCVFRRQGSGRWLTGKSSWHMHR